MDTHLTPTQRSSRGHLRSLIPSGQLVMGLGQNDIGVVAHMCSQLLLWGSDRSCCSAGTYFIHRVMVSLPCFLLKVKQIIRFKALFSHVAYICRCGSHENSPSSVMFGNPGGIYDIFACVWMMSSRQLTDGLYFSACPLTFLAWLFSHGRGVWWCNQINAVSLKVYWHTVSSSHQPFPKSTQLVSWFDSSSKLQGKQQSSLCKYKGKHSFWLE